MNPNESKDGAGADAAPGPGIMPVPANVAEEPEELCAVRAVRLNFPQICEQNIELWFVQLDHWFSANDIRSDSQKNSTVVASMSGTLLQHVYEHVTAPPDRHKYKALKAAIVTNFTDREQDETLLRGLWLQRLPPQVRTCLSTVGTRFWRPTTSATAATWKRSAQRTKLRQRHSSSATR